MKVAVIGGGGREHTFAWKLAQSPSVDKLYAIPGSAAMSEVAQCVDIALSDLDAITDYAKNEGIDMLVVGPEVPLTEGIADLAHATAGEVQVCKEDCQTLRALADDLAKQMGSFRL